MAEVKILYEDKDILVVEKPAGIPVETSRIGSKDMVSLLKNHLAETGGKPDGIPYLGMIHRLDQPVRQKSEGRRFPEQRNRSERDEKDLPRRRGRNRERRGIAHRLSLKGWPHQHFQKGSQRNQRREGVPALLRMPENTGRSCSRRPTPLPRPDSSFHRPPSPDPRPDGRRRPPPLRRPKIQSRFQRVHSGPLCLRAHLSTSGNWKKHDLFL